MELLLKIVIMSLFDKVVFGHCISCFSALGLLIGYTAEKLVWQILAFNPAKSLF